MSVERDQFVGIKAGEICFIGSWKKSYQKSCKKFIDGKNKLVMPGFINAHTHLAMTLFRGIEDDVPLHKWLFEKIFPLEAKFVDRSFVRVGTELASLECIRFGVTTLNDMYFYADEAAKVLDGAGLRGYVNQTFISVPTPEDKDLGTDKEKIFRQLAKKYENHSRIKIGLGPHAPYTCEDSVFKDVARLSKEFDALIHLHLNETQKEVSDHLKKHNKTPVTRMKELGVLTKKTALAHCVHMDEHDKKVLKETGVSIVYNPDSNMKLGSGVAPIPAYLKAGIPVAIGTDGAASNNNLSVISAMNIGTKLQKVANSDNTAMTAEEALRCATWLGAKALGLENLVGSLELGKRADLIFVDLNFPHMQPVHNLVSQLVYSAQGLEVDTVICDGKILMKHKKITALNEQEIMDRVEKVRKKISLEMKNWQ